MSYLNTACHWISCLWIAVWFKGPSFKPRYEALVTLRLNCQSLESRENGGRSVKWKMSEGKKCSLKSVAFAVNHLVTNGMAWRPVTLVNKQHLVTSAVVWCPVSSTERVSPETGVFIVLLFNVLIMGFGIKLLLSFKPFWRWEN